MISYVFMLNKDFKKIGLIDNFVSLIWDKKYNDFGEFELYIPATTSNFELIKNSKYVVRPDDDMVGLINKIELDTSAESGDYLIISGNSAESLLNQRILLNVLTYDGTVEDLARKLIDVSILNPEQFSLDPVYKRQMFVPVDSDYWQANPLIELGEKINIPDRIVTQLNCDLIGMLIQSLCKTYELGFRLSFSGDHLTFSLYKGEDLSEAVIFSEEFGNLSESKYIVDNSDLANFVLVGGEGEGTERIFSAIWGLEQSTNRFEIFVDAKDVSRTTNYGELKKMFPNGGLFLDPDDETQYYYGATNTLFPITSTSQLVQIMTFFPGGLELEIDGKRYWKVYLARIADFIESPLDDESQEVDTASALISFSYYNFLLIQKAVEKLTEHTSSVSFEGKIIPEINFNYKVDYNVGDIVKIKNKYGVSVNARITEVVEVFDDNGYSVEPKYEYITNEPEE